MSRCFDCFAEFASDADRFAVLKKMRDMPADADPVEARQLESLLWDFVYVCDDCCGWYDAAFRVSAEEAGA